MAPLIERALLACEWRQHRAFESATRDPEAAQARFLRALLATNADTAFGRAHAFSDMMTSTDYAHRVPIRDYEAMRPWVRRAMAGEGRVLTAEAPFMFTTTSGTTGEPKYIPVTPGWAAQMARLMRLWTRCALGAHPGMLARQVLTLVSPAVEGFTPAGVPFGAMTGFTYQRLPWLVRRRHALPYAAALIRDHDARYFVALRLALATAISSIATPNPSTLLRLAAVAGRHTEALIRAIHDGVLGASHLEPVDHAGLDAAQLRGGLEAGLAPAPARAAELGRLAQERGRLVLGDCWPGLKLLGCWLGGNAGIQARHLGEHFGAVPRRDLGLVASEGRITVPVDDETAAGVLAVHAGFFEFVPEEAIDDPAPPALPCHQIEEGRRYHVILSGANGLYRYDLNDVVEVRGFHHRTPVIAFVRKGRDMASITGEKLHLDHVLAAIRAAERATDLAVWQFRIIPDVEDSRYDLLVELRSAAVPDALRRFLGAFDDALARVNIEYASKRASRRLGPPRLHLMRPGWAERVCRREITAGRREVQHKWSAMRPEWDDASRSEVLDAPAAPTASE
jgi:hypothetical protein